MMTLHCVGKVGGVSFLGGTLSVCIVGGAITFSSSLLLLLRFDFEHCERGNLLLNKSGNEAKNEHLKFVS
jgi:hypothetical protein